MNFIRMAPGDKAIWERVLLASKYLALNPVPSFSQRRLSTMADQLPDESPADKKLLGVAESEVRPATKTRASMSPPAGDVAQTPEPKSTSGLASVFKSLTGSKLSKSLNPQSPVSSAQQFNTTNTLRTAIYGGPPNYEQLVEQLKIGNTLADRIAAADSLRHAVQDYPLSGVGTLERGCGIELTMLGDQHIQGRQGSHSTDESSRSSSYRL